MAKTLKRIAPLKFGLVAGIIYGLISLVFVPFLLLGIVASSFAPAQQGSMPQGLTVGLGLVLCIFIPVLYAVLGGLLGMLAAWLYNVVAGWTGGIEFEVE
jgi:hypothetical protein